MFYLIGVEHSVQSISMGESETAYQAEYRACLEQAIQVYKPLVVGEEYSKDSLARAEMVAHTPQVYFTKKIADSAAQHLLCDPEISTRKKMGYQSQTCWSRLIAGLWDQVSDSERTLLSVGLEIVKDFPLREKYWLDQLRSFHGTDVVFVCGDGHIESFTSLLKSKNIPSTVVRRKIGMPPDLIQKADSELEYARTHRHRIDEIYLKILKDNDGVIPPPCYPDVK